MRLREHGATVLVSALSALFAATLILGTGILAAAVDPALLAESGTFAAVLRLVSLVFILIALYVGAIVTSTTFATIIAGRTRTIALLRLIGATSWRVRTRVAAEGLIAGTVGGMLGLVLAHGLCAAAAEWGPGLGWLPAGRDYPLSDPLAFAALPVVMLTTWAAAWAGSRRVATVSPLAATGAAIEPAPSGGRRRSGRTIGAVILMGVGTALLVIGVVAGLLSPFALLIAFVGGLLSFSGIIVGAQLIMPPLLRLTGRALGTGPGARIAAANALREPERSSRATIGLVIGVTLVTMFAVALESYRRMVLIAFDDDPRLAASLDETLGLTTGVFSALVGFSAVIAAVGLVNTLSLGVLQRGRELGLLRALGFTGGQVRLMVVAESAQLTLAALGFGLLLGVGYGWAAAQSMLGSLAGFVAPAVPWPVLAGVAVFGVLLASVAALAPARRAIRVSPVEALAID